MLNNRKRFVISAAMGALLVLLAGGAKAHVPPTVYCVPSRSVNSSCAVPESTIGAAVALATNGDVIFVGPGTYPESVQINASITLLGAQPGNDARGDRHGPETIVNATGTGSSAFIVNAGGVVIDGFTIQGGTSSTAGGAPSPPAGIYMTAAGGSAHVRNNILQNNSNGVYLYTGASAPVIGHNLFRNNNAPAAPNYGYGIFINNVWYPVVTENEFTGNKTAAIDASVAPGDGTCNCYASITGNTSDNDGSFVIFTSQANGVFSHNRGKNFGRGALAGAGDAAVAVGYNNSSLVISDNDLENGEAPINNGIAFTTAFGTPSGNSGVSVTSNKIRGFPENGIVVEEGMLGGSWIVGNEVLDNGSDGILMQYGVNSLIDNQAQGNRLYDCEDLTVPFGPGPGTLGGYNYWFNDIGTSSSPTGLCTPGRGH
jgi:parallel beta-helix repeat protein